MKRLYIFLLAPLLLASVVNAQTLSDYYGGSLPSIAWRTPLAVEAGISNYSGTYSQNILLLNFLLTKPKSDPILGANPDTGTGGYNPVTGYISRTTQFVSAVATTIPVVATTDKSGNQIALNKISSAATVKVYMNLEPGTSKEEPIICTGITTTSWTGCTRGIAFQGSSESASTTATSHNAGAAIIITNIAQFYNQYVSVDGNQTINNSKLFSTIPGATSSTAIPSTGGQFATKYYADNIAAGGFSASNVSTTLGLLVTGTIPEQVGINASSTTGMAFDSSGKLYQKTSSTLGISSNSNGLYLVTTTPLTFSAPLTFTATTTLATTTIASSTITQLNLGGQNANTLITGANADLLHIHNYNKLIIASTTPTTTSSNTSAYSLLTFTMPANAMETNNILHVRILGSLQYPSVGGGGAGASFFMTYGGVQVATSSFRLISTASGPNAGVIDFYFAAASSTNAQSSWTDGNFVGASTGGAITGMKFSNYQSPLSINTTLSATVITSLQFSQADAALLFNYEGGYAELLQKF